MSRYNPRKATAALLPLPLKVGAINVTVRPMTLGMWAALERIGSPIVTGEVPKDVLELIPSLYLLTHDPREVFEEDLLDQAMQWANTLPVSALDAIRTACVRQVAAAANVMPETKKVRSAGTTAGSPRSSTGQPSGTAGDSRKSSGRSRSRRSAS